MARREFTTKTQQAAWDRSGGACEAEGAIYGMPAGVRCGADMTIVGVNYDHIDPDANSKDNSLENCCACCVPCHKWKTSNRDRPLIAKTDSQARMQSNIKPKWHRPMPGSRKSGIRKRMNGQVERRP